MSKKINVHPGQYKVAGREHQGEGIVASEHKVAKSMIDHELRQQARSAQKNSKRRQGK